MNKQILEKECDALALSYSRSENAFNEVKKISSHSSKKGYKTSAKAGTKGSNSI